jgi:hypothetical protein
MNTKLDQGVLSEKIYAARRRLIDWGFLDVVIPDQGVLGAEVVLSRDLQ